MANLYGTIPVIDGSEVPIVAGKQGHSCCGVCCDVRRAVIIVNCIMIFLVALDMFVALVVARAEFDDDDDDDEITEAIRIIPWGGRVWIQIIEVLLYGVGVWGALVFSSWQVYFALTMHSINFMANLSSFHLFSLLAAGFAAYPHVFLIQEISSGLMTRENYVNEEQSCCCL